MALYVCPNTECNHAVPRPEHPSGTASDGGPTLYICDECNTAWDWEDLVVKPGTESATPEHLGIEPELPVATGLTDADKLELATYLWQLWEDRRGSSLACAAPVQDLCALSAELRALGVPQAATERGDDAEEGS